MDLPVEIQKIIGPKETIELFIDGETYSDITVDTLALTNKRIIIQRSPTDPAKPDLTIYEYQDITGVGLEKGFMRSIIRLRVGPNGGTMDSIRMPPKIADQAMTYLKEKVCGIKSPF